MNTTWNYSGRVFLCMPVIEKNLFICSDSDCRNVSETAGLPTVANRSGEDFGTLARKSGSRIAANSIVFTRIVSAVYLCNIMLLQ